MCKVYNTVGSLTNVKSSLYDHHIYDFNSINELLKFHKSYPDTRQNIISRHKYAIEQEILKLQDELIELDNIIKQRRIEVEEELQSELNSLNQQLNDLYSDDSNVVNTIINFIKGYQLKIKIRNNKRLFNSEVANRILFDTYEYELKNSRNQFITTNTDKAIMESANKEIQELDRRNNVIEKLKNFIYGAIGEQKVVKELEKLNDDYILINDFNYNFHRAIFHHQDNSYIKSVQLDHILISNAGVFLIETKNWSQASMKDLNLYSPVNQIKRTNFVLYKLLHNYVSVNLRHHWGDRKIPIRNLIVLTNNKPLEEFQHVKVLELTELNNYISYFKPCFSNNETQQIADYLLNLSNK